MAKRKGLPSHIVKKYGMTKKAWSVYRRGTKTTKNRSRFRSTIKTKRRFNTMVKRRRKTRSYRKVRRSKSRGNPLIASLLGAVVYGGGREWMSLKIDPITRKLGIGGLGDEVGMGILSYLLAKGKIPFLSKIKMTRDIGKAGLIIEGSRAGQKLLSGGLGLFGKSGGNGGGNYPV